MTVGGRRRWSGVRHDVGPDHPGRTSREDPETPSTCRRVSHRADQSKDRPSLNPLVVPLRLTYGRVDLVTIHPYPPPVVPRVCSTAFPATGVPCSQSPRRHPHLRRTFSSVPCRRRPSTPDRSVTGRPRQGFPSYRAVRGPIFGRCRRGGVPTSRRGSGMGLRESRGREGVGHLSPGRRTGSLLRVRGRDGVVEHQVEPTGTDREGRGRRHHRRS